MPKKIKVQAALDLGNWASIAITLAASYFLIDWMLPETLTMNFFGEGNKEIPSMNVFYSACIGLAVGALISMVTAYYTSLGKNLFLILFKTVLLVRQPTSLQV